MMHYEYFGPHGERRSETGLDLKFARTIGERVISGFDVVQRFFYTPSGDPLFVTYFQADITGKVWALYY